jgi:Flp pilus assembly protein TadD
LDFHSNLGSALQAQGKINEAIESYRQAIQLDPKVADYYNNLSAALQAQGKLDEAEACLRRALVLTPNDADVLCNLATALFRQEKLDERSTYIAAQRKLIRGCTKHTTTRAMPFDCKENSRKRSRVTGAH